MFVYVREQYFTEILLKILRTARAYSDHACSRVENMFSTCTLLRKAWHVLVIKKTTLVGINASYS